MKLFTMISAGLVLAAASAQAQSPSPSSSPSPGARYTATSDLDGPYADVPPAPVPGYGGPAYGGPAYGGPGYGNRAYGGPGYDGQGYGYGPEGDGPSLLPPSQVYIVLRQNGFSPLGSPRQRGFFYTITAIDPRGDDGRLVIDGRNGRIVRFMRAYHFGEGGYGGGGYGDGPDGYGPPARLSPSWTELVTLPQSKAVACQRRLVGMGVKVGFRGSAGPSSFRDPLPVVTEVALASVTQAPANRHQASLRYGRRGFLPR